MVYHAILSCYRSITIQYHTIPYHTTFHSVFFLLKVELEKIRVHEQDKQIAMLTRENETVKEKLKKAEDMSKTLQNLLKDLTDEKLELLDSIEELNEEKAELEEARCVYFSLNLFGKDAA